jgi:hypothetical protein
LPKNEKSLTRLIKEAIGSDDLITVTINNGRRLGMTSLGLEIQYLIDSQIPIFLFYSQQELKEHLEKK